MRAVRRKLQQRSVATTCAVRLKVTGGQSSVDEEETIGTKSKASKLTIVVTDVRGN
jgi:hypothetical protein